MLVIKVADVKQVESIVALADTIWHEYFTPIIGKEQIDYMLQKFQSKESIIQQIHDGVIYFLMINDSVPIGYAAIILKDDELFLSKYYILLSERNKGYGRQSMTFMEQLAFGQDIEKISLTVHKYNSNAISAYEKMGFSNLGSVVQDIDGGFVMDDYKMEKFI